MQLSTLKGVGKRKEERLKENGYRCVEDVAEANLNALDDIKGIDAGKIVAEAQSKVPEYKGRKQRDDVRSPYICECGKRFSSFSGLRAHSGENGEKCQYETWSRSKDKRVRK